MFHPLNTFMRRKWLPKKRANGKSFTNKLGLEKTKKLKEVEKEEEKEGKIELLENSLDLVSHRGNAIYQILPIGVKSTPDM